MKIEMYVWACPEDSYRQVGRVVSRDGDMLYLLLLGTLRHVTVHRIHVERIDEPVLRERLCLDYNYGVIWDDRFDFPYHPFEIF